MRFITHRSWRVSWHAWGHRARLWVQRKRAWASGSFIEAEGGSLRVLQVHFLLVNLKRKSGNLKHKKRKTSTPSGELCKSTKISTTKKPD